MDGGVDGDVWMGMGMGLFFCSRLEVYRVIGMGIGVGILLFGLELELELELDCTVYFHAGTLCMRWGGMRCRVLRGMKKRLVEGRNLEWNVRRA